LKDICIGVSGYRVIFIYILDSIVIGRYFFTKYDTDQTAVGAVHMTTVLMSARRPLGCLLGIILTPVVSVFLCYHWSVCVALL